MSRPAHLAFNESGRRAPVVFLHTWGSEESRFAGDLAAALGPEQPLYALSPPDDPTALLAIDTVDDWVAWHRVGLDGLPLQPPYRLMGWSMGGVVAVELARQLARDGTAVDQVGLIDSWLPSHRPRAGLPRVADRLDRLVHQSWGERGAYLAAQSARLARRGAGQVRRRIGSEPSRPRRPVDPAHRSIWVPHLKYRPSPVPAGPAVTIYSTAISIDHQDGDASLGWSTWLQHGYDAVTVPGDHWSMWDDAHIDALAAAIATQLGP